MPARISAEMLRAIQMIKDGANRYEAAKATGVTITAITRSRLYQEWIADVSVNTSQTPENGISPSPKGENKN